MATQSILPPLNQAAPGCGQTTDVFSRSWLHLFGECLVCFDSLGIGPTSPVPGVGQADRLRLSSTGEEHLEPVKRGLFSRPTGIFSCCQLPFCPPSPPRPELNIIDHFGGCVTLHVYHFTGDSGKLSSCFAFTRLYGVEVPLFINPSAAHSFSKLRDDPIHGGLHRCWAVLHLRLRRSRRKARAVVP